MKAWLVVNTFMRTVKFNNLYNMLSLAFKKHNVDLEVKTASDISLEVNQPILNKPDFALFWDKDIYLAKRLENEGIKLFNNAKAVELCDNKILMYQELARCGVRIPRTFIAPKTFEGLNYTSRDFVDNVINEIGLPLVIKEAYGSFGEQVYLANSKEEANKIIDQIGYKDFLMQEYIANSKGRDIRVNVVGDEAIVSMYRENLYDFRSNISNGGTGKRYEPKQKYLDLAIKAAQALDLTFAGVDVLFGEDDEPIICEVNSNPQFASTLSFTGVNLGEYIADYIMSLTIKRGLIVYDFKDALRNKWFVNKCLEELNNKSTSLSFIHEAQLDDYLAKNSDSTNYVIYRGRNHQLVASLEAKGIKVFNNALTNKLANDKYQTYEFLLDHDLPCIKTTLDFSNINHFPAIMKSVSGHGGEEVYLIEDKDDPQYETLLKENPDLTFIYQEFVQNNGDVRVYVLNHKVVVAIKRVNPHNYRNNFSLGGEVSVYQLSPEMEEAAIKVSELLDADFIGVDFLLSDNGFMINEIEDPVGCRMVYQATNIDIVSLFCKHVKNNI
ncbi:MAG: RimK family alpha-L-glutamate ligase [Bacilli bacterium]|nr:RimK family alpha-L-glutamate ligase [Bacilli bacterium]